ncbi:macrocin O-methyltransferase [Frankia sp. CcI49]|uniref:TylF/MycF family methyltransferase n=1 Tax=unclassified Frankia TaxID=2632575 RepID=UPI0006C9F4EB|nr:MULTISPECIES: TylF/MycF family methyltransferase [unclassified Frankia]KPM54927.1 macrocin-O-methyltransferase [Frankia sp. R43]ONH61131.1 macrocin O-methyltransferase [Frankia sp. CcI49]
MSYSTTTANTETAPGSSELTERYLTLLQDTLTFSLWDSLDGQVWIPEGTAKRTLVRFLEKYGLEIIRRTTAEKREHGGDWPRLAHTMTGSLRMRNLRDSVETVLAEGVPGDLVETGVWRGGSCILMRGILFAYGVDDRTVWLADSFRGLPKADAQRYPADAGDRHHEWAALAVSEEDVRRNFRRYGLLDSQVRFLSGWFRDTLPTAPIERIAVLRLDGDMYGSTMEALDALYPRLSDGGFCIVDDYGAVEGCRRAVEDFRTQHNITEPLTKIDWTGVYWRRNSDDRREPLDPPVA